MWGQLLTTCDNATELAQWWAPSYSLPQPATDNGVRDGRSNWPAVTHTLHRAVPHELRVLHDVNAGYKSQDLLQQPGREHASLCMPGQRTGHSGYNYEYIKCLQLSAWISPAAGNDWRPTHGEHSPTILRRLFIPGHRRYLHSYHD